VVARIVATFSFVATGVVAALFIAGAVLLFNLLPDWSAFTTPYGRLVLVKVAVFAILLGLAALNRWRHAPMLGQEASARHAFQRTVLAEYLLMASVLVLTAVLTSFYSPEPAE
jgi:putative copper export protein